LQQSLNFGTTAELEEEEEEERRRLLWNLLSRILQQLDGVG
jgi:hypothetical protein